MMHVFLYLRTNNPSFSSIYFFQAVVLSIVKETELTSTDLCSLSLGCNPINNPLLNWNISLPNTPKPPVVTPKLPEVTLKLLVYFIEFLISLQINLLAKCPKVKNFTTLRYSCRF
jgi:hypothetical protein